MISTSIKELRKFGLIMFLVLACGFGVAFPLLAGKAMRPIPLAVGVGFATIAALAPTLLHPVFDVWMRVGVILGWINSRIILGAVYCILIVPYGLILKLMGKDAMRRNLEKERTSYREPVNNEGNPQRMEKPY